MHLKKAQDVINKLRKIYDAPISNASSHIYPHRYCVGGALGRGACGPWKKLLASITGFPDDPRYHFPGNELIAILHTYNSELPYDKAVQFAAEIVHSNDKREFAVAWHIAEEALAWPTSICEFSSAELS